MVSINLICVGKLKEKYLISACSEYLKRLQPYCKVKVIEVSEHKLPDNPSASQICDAINKEGKKIIIKIPSNSFVVSLCIEGKQLSSEEMSHYIQQIAVNGKSEFTFIIGGSWGLSREVKDFSDIKLSMSKMTFPHQLARVILLEQIYRSFQILMSTKYHK